MAPAKLTANDLEECLCLYDAGLSLAKIGELFGVSGVAIRYRLKNMGALKVQPRFDQCVVCGKPGTTKYCSHECSGRGYYQKNAELVKARSREYINANKEEVARKKAEYRAANRKKLAAQENARYHANKDAVLPKMRERRKRLPKEVNDKYQEKYRCKKRRSKMELELSLLAGILCQNSTSSAATPKHPARRR